MMVLGQFQWVSLVPMTNVQATKDQGSSNGQIQKGLALATFARGEQRLRACFYGGIETWKLVIPWSLGNGSLVLLSSVSTENVEEPRMSYDKRDVIRQRAGLQLEVSQNPL